MLQGQFTLESGAVSTVSVIGTRVEYLRWQGCYRKLTGTIIAEQSHKPLRWNGETVWEYLIQPDAGQTNLSEHIIWEGDILKWGIES